VDHDSGVRANSAAAALGGGTPIDFGKVCSDGRRVFGDGKTYRGFFGGVLCGILAGLVEIWAWSSFNLTALPPADAPLCYAACGRRTPRRSRQELL